MLPAQAAAKWPPCLLGGEQHDGPRRTPNTAAPFHRTRPPWLATVRYFIPRPGCAAYFRSQPRPKAQRSHVTLIRATILLTFSAVKAGGGEQASRGAVPRRPRASARGRRGAPLGLTARAPRVDSGPGSAMCACARADTGWKHVAVVTGDACVCSDCVHSGEAVC